MSDESPRSAFEKTPDQRRSTTPPGWWRELTRTDLPTGAGGAAFTHVNAPHERAREIEVVIDERPKRRVSVVLVVALVVNLVCASALLVAGNVAIRIVGTSMIVLATLVIIVPVLVARVSRDR